MLSLDEQKLFKRGEKSSFSKSPTCGANGEWSEFLPVEVTITKFLFVVGRNRKSTMLPLPVVSTSTTSFSVHDLCNCSE